MITSSLVQHDNRKLEFCPHPSSPPSRSQNAPSAIDTHNAHDVLSGSSSSSSSSTSSSLTSSPSMSLDKKSQMHNSDPLQLDLQFSLPAVMIMILSCLGYASFYDLVMQQLELLSGSFQSRAPLNFVLMAIGFLLLRLSANFCFIHPVSLIRNHSTINSNKPRFLD